MSNRGKKGQTLLEVVAAIALVTIVVTALVGLAVAAVRSANISKNRAQATSYAQEGLEALRSIRDRSFDELKNCCTTATCQLVPPGAQWTCINGPGETSSIFTRSFTKTEVESGKLRVVMIVAWTDNAGDHNVTLVSWLTDWR